MALEIVVLERLDRIRQTLLKGIEGITDQELNDRTEGSWSISEVLEHLYLTEVVVAKQVAKSLREESQPAAEKPVHLTAQRGKQVAAPEVLIPKDEVRTLEEIIIKLENSRKALLYVIEHAKPEVDWTQKSAKHLAFGWLSLKQWIEFLGYHEQRHIQQIEEILSGLKR